jgi:hypothetical protein
LAAAIALSASIAVRARSGVGVVSAALGAVSVSAALGPVTAAVATTMVAAVAMAATAVAMAATSVAMTERAWNAEHGTAQCDQHDGDEQALAVLDDQQTFSGAFQVSASDSHLVWHFGT